MRRPTRRTPSRGQRTPRRPTPLPSRPVRGRPKGPPVRGVPKNPPRPRPIRGGRRITEPPRPVRGGPKTPPKPPGGRVPKRVKEPLTPIKKTPPNTGTSTKTAKREKLDAVPVKANPNIKLANAEAKKAQAAPVKRNLPISQRQPTAAERRQMEAALRAREAKAPDKQAAAKAAELQRRLFNDAQRAASKNARPKTRPKRGPISVGPAQPFKGTPRQTLRPPTPTGSRAAAIRRRRRRGGGGLAGALRRRRARIGR